MKRFPFQRATSGKLGGAALGTGGDHAARTGRVPPRYLQWGGWMPRCQGRESAALPGAGGITLPGMRGAILSRNRTPYQSHPGKQLRNRYCQIAVLPSLPAVLLNLLYCQVGRLVKPAVLLGLAVLPSLLFVKSVVLPNLPYCQICRLLSMLYCQVRRKRGVCGFG